MKAWQALSSGWTAFAIPSNIQKRLYKFLLRKSIGRFLAQDLDFENFDVELVNGCIELRDLDLNLEVLDELISDSPLSITEGHIGGITASLPWSNFWSGDIVLEMRGLRLTLKPELNRPKREKAQVDEEPVLSTSMHLAGDFLKTEVLPNEDEELRQSIHLSTSDSPSVDFSNQQDVNLEGLQVLTKVIDKMLARIKVKVIDTVLRLHHTSAIPLNSRNDIRTGHTSLGDESRDYYLDIQIPNISYFDETPGLSDSSSKEPSPPDINMQTSSILLPPAMSESIKILVVTSPTVWIRSGLDVSVHSFGTASDHDLAAMMKESSLVSGQSDSELNDSSMFHSAMGDSHMSGSITPQQAPNASPNMAADSTYEALIFSTMDKENWFRFKFAAGQPAEWSSAIQEQSRLSMKQLDVLVSSICISLSPKQVAWLSELLENFTGATNSTDNPVPTEFDTVDKTPLEDDNEDLQELLKSSTPEFGIPESPVYHTPSLRQVHEKKFESNPHLQSRFDNIPQTRRPVLDMNQERLMSPLYSNQMVDLDRGRTSSSMSFSTLHQHQKQAAPVKIKFSLTSANLYLLMNETSSPVSPSFFSAPSPALLDTNHLKLSLNHFVLRYKDWSSLISDKASSSTHRPSRGRGNFTLNDNNDEISFPRNALDIRISDISIHEWLMASGDDHQPLPGMSRLRYDVYNPILQFNELLPKTYRSENDFSTISLADLPQNDGKREALRFKAETWVGKPDTPVRQDIAMDIKPLLLNLDIRIIDRVDEFMLAMIDRPKKSIATHANMQDYNLDNGNAQYTNEDIYADLKQSPGSGNLIRSRSIKLPFIRIVLLTPDMTHANTRGESTELVHDDFFIIDINKLSSRDTGGENESDFHGDDRSTSPQHAEPLEDVDYLHAGSSGGLDSRQTSDKIQIQFECEGANIFLKKAKESEPTCWFMVKSCLESPLSTPSKANAKKLSSFHITICTKQPDNSNSDTRFRTLDPSQDRNIPYTIFENLKRDEHVQDDEEKIHIPREEQSKLSTRFKRHSVESSMISIKCHLPLTRMNLAKETWDTVQILQNDLILWQPTFLNSMPKSQHETNVPKRNVPNLAAGKSRPGYGHPGARNRSSSFDQRDNEPTVNLHGGDSLSILSIMACLQNAEWTLHYPKDLAEDVNLYHTYDAIMSNFQYFAVIKNMGQDENITTLDIDEISLFDVKSESEADLLLERTIPKSLQYDSPMVSIMTKLQNNIEENMQDKSSSVIISNLKFNYSADVSFIDNLVKFQNAPAEMNIIDPPAAFIKVYVTVDDTSVLYSPLDNTLQAAIVFDELKLVTDIFPNQERLSVNVQMRALDLYLTDDRTELSELNAVTRLKGHSVNASRWWRNVGMARCLAMRDLEVNVSVALRPEEQLALDVALTNHVLGFEVCKDSLPTIMNLIAIATSSASVEQPTDNQEEDQQEDAKSAPKESSLKVESSNMLASLDEQAFIRRNASSDDNSNVKTNDMEYVEEYYAAIPPVTRRDDDAHNESANRDIEEMLIVPPRKPRRKNASPMFEDIIHVIQEDDEATIPLMLDENHFSKDRPSMPKQSKVDISNSIKRIRLKDFNIVCKLYDGYDWRHTRQSGYATGHETTPSRSYSSGTSVPQVHPRTPFDQPDRQDSPLQPQTHYKDELNPVFDPTKLSQHQRASSEAGYLAEDLSDTTSQYSRFQYNTTSAKEGKRPAAYHQRSASSPDSLRPRRSSRRSKNTRSQSARLEIRLEQINVEFDLLPSTGQLASNLHISVRDFDIYDHIKTSMYRKFLSYMRSNIHPRETGSNMIRFELTSVRPVPSEAAEEHRLKFRILPMRLYIDQDAVIFLINFFSFDPKLLKSTPTNTSPAATTAKRQEDRSTFFQHVEIYPVILKVDYRPKHVNYGSLKDGQFAELVNFFHLDAAEMNLSHVKLTGIKGYDRLAEAVLNHWLPHIRDTQLGNVVTGVSSIQSVVNIGSGVADLVLLPIEQYRKDGRIIRGLQRGTQSFARATTMEAIKIGSRLAAGTQVILEQADDFFSPLTPNETSAAVQEEYDSDGEPSAVERRPNDSDSDTQEVISKFADQPSDLSQGLQHAYHSLSKNIKSAANTVLAVPTEIQESEDPHGTAKAVIRAVPVAVIRPLIGFSEAFANVLVGIRNTIDPGQKIQSVEKYKRG